MVEIRTFNVIKIIFAAIHITKVTSRHVESLPDAMVSSFSIAKATLESQMSVHPSVSLSVIKTLSLSELLISTILLSLLACFMAARIGVRFV